MARITVGNAVITGFVNLVAENRLLVGTGSYVSKDGQKVFKESVTVFIDDKFDGDTIQKGDFVRVSADLVVSPRKEKADELQVTMNVRFKNQLVKTEAPKKADAPAAGNDAGSAADDEDI